MAQVASLESVHRRLSEQMQAAARAEKIIANPVLGPLSTDLVEDWHQLQGQLDNISAVCVVALAGPTGTGKSSLFNLLTNTENAQVGVLRPTTQDPVSGAGADTDIATSALAKFSTQHFVVPTGKYPTGMPPGLVLVDLPDFDSVDKENRQRAQEIQNLADVIVWVVDPQKYADALWHNEFLLQPRYRARTNVVVLTHADTLSPQEQEGVLADLKELFTNNGLEQTPVFMVSNRRSSSINQLAGHLATMAGQKLATLERISAHLSQSGQDLQRKYQLSTPQSPDKNATQGATAAVAAAAGRAIGMEAIAAAAQRHYLQMGSKAVVWPPLAPLRTLKTDPLGRLHLGSGGEQAPEQNESEEQTRQSASELATILTEAREEYTDAPTLQPVSSANRALLEHACKQYYTKLSDSLSRRWQNTFASYGNQLEEALEEALQKTISKTQLPSAGGNWWRGVFRLVHWLLLAVGVLGLSWVIIIQAAKALLVNLPVPMMGQQSIVSWPAFLTIIGLGSGLLWSVIGMVLVRKASCSYRAAVKRALNNVVRATTEQAFTLPLEQLLQWHDELFTLAKQLGYDADLQNCLPAGS